MRLASGLELVILCTLLASCTRIQKEYDDDGRLRAQYKTKDGKKHGQAVQFYRTGETMRTTTWDNGVLSGPSVSYYLDGGVKTAANYSNDQLVDLFTSYDSLGNLRSESMYSNGELAGPFKVYYADGAVRLKGTYSGKGTIKKSYEYYSSGEFRSYKYVVNDTVYYEKTFDQGGSIVSLFFPLQVGIREGALCIELLHSHFDPEEIEVHLFLDLLPSEPDFKQDGYVICIDDFEEFVVSGILAATLCEYSKRDDMIAGCNAFKYDLSSGEFLKY